MKRLTVLILAAALLLASCGNGKAGYKEAFEETKGKKEFAVKVENVLTVSDGENTEEYTDSVLFTQVNGFRCAVVNGVEEYYLKDGQIFTVTKEGSSRWEGGAEDFFALFCYAEPADTTVEADKGGKYTATLDPAEYGGKMLSAVPYISSYLQTLGEGKAFERIEYSASVEDGIIKSYSFDFAFTMGSEGESAAFTNKMTVTYTEPNRSLSMPEGYESFDIGGDVSISEEAFTREVMMIIVEALYNSDGTRKDNFDEIYQEFVEMYGEETMAAFVGGIEEYNASVGIGQ